MNLIARINLPLFFVFISSMNVINFPQDDLLEKEVSYNMLLPPVSPGFVLMGKEPASVERPGSVSDLAVTILNQSKNFTIVPLNYALEAAPYWLIGAPNLTFEEYSREGSVPENFLQTLSISLASSTEELDNTGENSSVTSAAAGVRFSLLKGAIDPAFNDYSLKLDSIIERMKFINKIFHEEIVKRKQDDKILDSLKRILFRPEITAEEVKAVEEKLRLRNEKIENEIDAELKAPFLSEAEIIRNIVSSLQLRRIGWKLDFAGGILVNFPGQKFNKGEFNRYGLWLNGGYEWTNFSGLGVFRFSADPKNSGLNSYDIGGRFIYDNLRMFAFSAEGIFRKLSGPVTDDSQWRAAIIIDYYFGENKKISFTFGKNFEGQTGFNTGGDLITAVNLLFGFGTERPIR
ncbi:MAG: hypothetical protein ACM339_14910 [Ignavibacteria bacterium]